MIVHPTPLSPTLLLHVLPPGVPPAYPCIIETEFKRPTLLPAKMAFRWQASSPKQAVDLSHAAAGLAFSVVTSDSQPKDVIVGRLIQQKI